MTRSLVVALLALFLLANAAPAAPIEAPFESAYFVASPGSTTPVKSFHIDGPAPSLFVDLGAPRGQYSYASSRWFSEYESVARFSVNEGDWFSTERRYWLSPSPEQWASMRGVGEWHVDVSYAWWTLAMTYGVGAPLTNARGTDRVSFWVVAHPIPEPAATTLLATAMAGMAMRRARSMKCS